QPKADLWESWLLEEIPRWKNLWLTILHGQPAENLNAHQCAAWLAGFPENPSRAEAAVGLKRILETDASWPARSKGRLRKPIESFFAEADFLCSLCVSSNGIDPLQEDWTWAQPQILALLQLGCDFATAFARAKRDAGAVDFHDLEQFSLQLLWDKENGRVTPIAEQWRQKLRLIFVDEYQDINAAQDAILHALAREGSEANRFLVGDIKQSIYRFRLANPGIF